MTRTALFITILVNSLIQLSQAGVPVNREGISATGMAQLSPALTDICSTVNKTHDDVTLAKSLITMIGIDSVEDPTHVMESAQRIRTTLLSLFDPLAREKSKNHPLLRTLVPSREGLIKSNLSREILNTALQLSTLLTHMNDSTHPYVEKLRPDLEHTITNSMSRISCYASRLLELGNHDDVTLTTTSQPESMKQEITSSDESEWYNCNDEISCSKRDLAIVDVLFDFFDFTVDALRFHYRA